MKNNYKLIRSNRKSISIEIDNELNVLVRAPKFTSKFYIDKVVSNHANWIEIHKKQKEEYLKNQKPLSSEEIKELKKLAKEVLPKKADYYSNIMGVYPSGIKITSAKKRFGSCNSKNSICFSYNLMRYDERAIDYVVVHELAHIKHHNHSKDFYDFIYQFMPDYKEREKLLKSVTNN